MELDWLEDFLALVQTGNFSRAAEFRNITQPAFSRRIRALEQWMGAQLFDRDAQRVQLTPAGKKIWPEIQDIVRRAHAARDHARETASAAQSTLRFLSTHVLSTTFFPGWMQSIEATFILDSPMSLIADNMAGCEAAMERGEAHFLLCHHHPSARIALSADHFESIVVGADTLIAASAPGQAGAPMHRLNDTSEAAAFLDYSPTSGMGRIVEAAVPRSPASTPAFVSPLASVLFGMARNGKGVAWLPLSLIQRAMERGQLVRAASAETDIPIEIRLFRPTAAQSAVADKFWTAAKHAAGA
jgi:LysR family transcriptional regulator, hypochlorite-specific transcription factor HypT